MKNAIIIGSGAGGATAAKELQGAFQVTVLEAGGIFKPLRISLPLLEQMRRTHLFFTEKMIRMLLPAYRISKTSDNIVLVRGSGVGGTTPLACGNALRADSGLKGIGINLDREFLELEREIPITADHKHLWKETTRNLFKICSEGGFDPFSVPKAGNYNNCMNCGHCTLGCPHGIKWDASIFIRQALSKGAEILFGCKVIKIVIENNRAIGILTHRGFIPSDLIIVAAGGISTPVLLEKSGIKTDQTFFVDPVLCVAAEYENAYQNKELPMPFAVQRDGYIISPYFDQLSFFFNKHWRMPGKNIISLMIKLADTRCGNPKNKRLSEKDKHTLDHAVDECKWILSKMGIKPRKTFLGKLNAGHPGGMFPLSMREATSFHSERLPENVYVADASLFPASLGNPPMLTIMAMAKRVSKIVMEKF